MNHHGIWSCYWYYLNDLLLLISSQRLELWDDIKMQVWMVWRGFGPWIWRELRLRAKGFNHTMFRAQAYSPKTKCCQQGVPRNSLKWKSLNLSALNTNFRLCIKSLYGACLFKNPTGITRNGCTLASSPSFLDQLRIVHNFKTIRERAVYEHPDSHAAGLQEALDEETAHAMQGDASSILQLARDIQTYAPRCVEVAEVPRTSCFWCVFSTPSLCKL